MKQQNKLEEGGIGVRVVSMLSNEIFDKQDNEYKEEILPSNVDKEYPIETGSTSLAGINM